MVMVVLSQRLILIPNIRGGSTLLDRDFFPLSPELLHQIYQNNFLRIRPLPPIVIRVEPPSNHIMARLHRPKW